MRVSPSVCLLALTSWAAAGGATTDASPAEALTALISRAGEVKIETHAGSEYETAAGGTWRVAGIADYWSKYEFGWHWSPSANQHDAITAVEMALAEAQRLLEATPMLEHLTDPDTGEIIPITLVTDNGGPFRSFRFGALIAARPELRHVRPRVRSPGQSGVRERAFGSL